MCISPPRERAHGYRAAAPDEVGLGRYPGGPEAYRYLVGRHTTSALVCCTSWYGTRSRRYEACTAASR